MESRKKRGKKRALMKVIKGIIQALKDTITGLLQSMLLVGAVLAGTDFEIFLHLSYKERERERERESGRERVSSTSSSSHSCYLATYHVHGIH